jgi:hypothetical protein
MERETGIEPATNSLEGCDSTTELLPPSRYSLRATPRLSGPASRFRSLHRRAGRARIKIVPATPPVEHALFIGCRAAASAPLVLRLPDERPPLTRRSWLAKQPAHLGASVAEPKVASPLADEWLANRSSLDDPCERRLVAREGLEPSKPLGRQIYSLLRLTASLPRQPVCVGMPCFRQYVCAGSAGFDNALQNKPPDGAGGGI